MDTTYWILYGYSLLTVIGGALSLGLLALLVPYIAQQPLSKKIIEGIKTHILAIGLLISTLATAGSLYFSEVALFNPCKLCWIQRIFMYPLVFLFGLSLIKKDGGIKPYALTLSITGMFIAGYHYFLQMQKILFPNLDITTPCSVIGYAPSCTEYFTLQFGYVTIPMMALTAFTLITLLLIVSMKKKS